jgi:hypothetical protein
MKLICTFLCEPGITHRQFILKLLFRTSPFYELLEAGYILMYENLLANRSVETIAYLTVHCSKVIYFRDFYNRTNSNNGIFNLVLTECGLVY